MRSRRRPVPETAKRSGKTCMCHMYYLLIRQKQPFNGSPPTLPVCTEDPVQASAHQTRPSGLGSSTQPGPSAPTPAGGSQVHMDPSKANQGRSLPRNSRDEAERRGQGALTLTAVSPARPAAGPRARQKGSEGEHLQGSGCPRTRGRLPTCKKA